MCLAFGILVTIVAQFFFCFSCLALFALQNVNKHYTIFSYFRNFFAKRDQKPKMKNGMNETLDSILPLNKLEWSAQWGKHLIEHS